MASQGARITQTDTGGRFVFRALAPGPILVRVRSLGFAPTDTLVQALAGAVSEIVLVLARVPRVLDTVVVTEPRRCARYGLEGVLCRRGSDAGLFLSEEEIQAKNPRFIGDILGDEAGFRRVPVYRNRTGTGRLSRVAVGTDVESTVGWRCITTIVDGGRPVPLPRVRDIIAVEVYQPDQIPLEYHGYNWRGRYPCTLVIYWSSDARRR